jgi:hypothetical protein
MRESTDESRTGASYVVIHRNNGQVEVFQTKHAFERVSSERGGGQRRCVIVECETLTIQREFCYSSKPSFYSASSEKDGDTVHVKSGAPSMAMRGDDGGVVYRV